LQKISGLLFLAHPVFAQKQINSKINNAPMRNAFVGLMRVTVVIVFCAQSMDSALESWDSNGLDGVSARGNDKANSQEPQPFDGSSSHL